MKPQAPLPRIVVVGTNPILEELCRDVCATHGWQADSVPSTGTLHLGYAGCELLISDLAIPAQVEHVLAARSHGNSPEVLFVSSSSPAVHSQEDLLRRGANGILSGLVDSRALDAVLEAMLPRTDTGRNGLFPHSGPALITTVYDTKTLSEVKPTLCLVDELEAQGRLCGADRKKLELAFQEAVTNAVDHGSLELDSRCREQIDAQGRDHFSQLKAQRLSETYYTSRKVVISFQYSVDRYAVRVRDEGPGFSPPLAMTNPQLASELKCSGRGITIMEGSVDELSFAHGGREVCMCKHVPILPKRDKGCHGT